MRQISLYEIATADIDQNGVPRPGMETYEHVRRVATEAIRQALEIAAEEATAKIGYESDIERLIDYKVARVDKKSILNVIERVK